MGANAYIEKKLQQRIENQSYRELKAESHLIDFSSNDYLGFARSPQLKQLIADELIAHPNHLNGSSGSRLLSGNTTYSEELELMIADYHNAHSALLFNSGYDANLGLLSSVPQRGDTVIHDELAHASIIDGVRLSHADRLSFSHNDIHDLERKLSKAKGTIFIVVESVYSMDGDIAPLKQLCELAETYKAEVIVDEAHAIGVFGKGLISNLGLETAIFARVITFGKAMGCHGAAVLGDAVLKRYLVNFARSFIYTTAASFHQLAAIKMAYKMLDLNSDEFLKLQKNIALYNDLINQEDPSQNLTESAIKTIVIGGNDATRRMAELIQQSGFDVRPILSPTVKAGTERLRICLHSYNTSHEMTTLVQLIQQLHNEK
ncbi:aminotransferase class I/II-fold pyridoxal phosphate-dependent enzyme [Mucilaginibacter aquatilis]|uniref:Aminotransferase class I/II-fold pyridoxal phosphate-dependent enzyme n=1 Tax=Mucilaginibacter aquatilis TaxID=1517760 RepID=A0A6I4ID07_9SPHI|nr:8-amino-7-oxononanoate synthase [Mucilaginibacter aquatilis]MVN93081.1 aminotransferase class I/II-fold pyridoxal phosphate-dependent enzyme [Mucilaginibacter aquatilis]